MSDPLVPNPNPESYWALLGTKKHLTAFSVGSSDAANGHCPELTSLHGHL